MSKLTKVILGQAVCLLCFIVFCPKVSAAKVPAPTLLEPQDGLVIGEARPYITGLTVSGTKVHVYIDGVQIGKSGVLIHQSGTANFAMQSIYSLSVGEHMAWAITEDQQGQKSSPSKILHFSKGLATPAPTMLAPVINASSSNKQPFIVGLAKNDSLIKVFINDEVDGEFMVKNHSSGTANFAYQPSQELAERQHLIYTTATDSQGKESKKSQPVYYYPGRKPTIGQAAQARETGKVVEIKPVEEKKEEPEVIVSPSEGTVVDEQKDLAIDKEIQDIIDKGVATPTAETGLIDEGEEEQGKLNLNLIIFIVFLVGIIAWIFWVNRELIKEKREQAGKDQESKDQNKR